MSKKKITVIIPTYERKKYIKRSAYYWSNKNLIVHILDGSKKALSLKDRINFADNIHYHHLNLGLIERIKYSANLINTKFTCMISDDEFFLESALNKFVNELEANKEYSCCAGLVLRFDYEKKRKLVTGYDQYIETPYLNLKKLNLIDDKPLDRVNKHLENYVPTSTYTLTRSENFKKIVNLIGLKEYNAYCSWELQFEIAMSLLGKTKILPILYWLRSNEVEPTRGTSPSMTKSNDFNKWWNQKKNKSEKETFLKDLLSIINDTNDHSKKKLETILNNYTLNKKTINNNYHVSIKIYSKIFLKLFKQILPVVVKNKFTKNSLNNKVKKIKRLNIEVNIKEINDIIVMIKKYDLND